jgi:phosphomethylpyrimidine synthase
MNKKQNNTSQITITREPFPRSRKVYVRGKIHDIMVAMREIELDDSDPVFAINGKSTKNYSITVYDTSGPYTDPNVEIDITRGLPRLRERWILERGDVERLPNFSSEYTRKRLQDPRLDPIRF